MATVILEVADGCEEQSSHMTYALDMTLASWYTGSLSSSCEIIILRNKGLANMGTFTTALMNKKKYGQILNIYFTLLPQCIACCLIAYYVEKKSF